MRCFVVDGRVAHIIYSSFERVDVDGYPRDFVKYERDQAIRAAGTASKALAAVAKAPSTATPAAPAASNVIVGDSLLADLID